MKSLFVHIFLVSCIFSSFSQNNNGKIEYKMFLSFEKTIEYNSILVFDKENSLFSYRVKGNGVYENNETSSKFNTIVIDTTTNIILVKKNKKTLYESHINKKKGNYYTFENQQLIKWELLSGTKIFNDITCSLAKTNFRGRTYYAWYAPTIPISNGPWKLNGLPGLILEAYDETKEIIFKFNKIQIPFKYSFNTINNKITKSKNISLLEHINAKKNINKTDIENNIKTKFPRGITVKVEVKKTGIELNFNDLLNDKD